MKCTDATAKIEPYLLIFIQFEKVLTEEKTQLSLDNDKPLTTSDCDFLLKLGIRARPRQRFLRVDPMSQRAIHEYGILFKLLSGKFETV